MPIGGSGFGRSVSRLRASHASNSLLSSNGCSVVGLAIKSSRMPCARLTASSTPINPEAGDGRASER